jgi:hypothetical protein
MRSTGNSIVALRLHRCSMHHSHGPFHSVEGRFHSSSKVFTKRNIRNEIGSEVSSEEEFPDPKKPKRSCDDGGFEEEKGVAPAPVTPLLGLVK